MRELWGIITGRWVTLWIMELMRKSVSGVIMKRKNKLYGVIQEDTGG